MLRHLSHRTGQVRDLVFFRDAIKRKDVKTTGQTSATKGSSTALAGPAVNFGYETDSYAAQSAGTDTAYHISSPEIIIPGLKAIQSPITSRSGQHERTGHRITGECKFYMPTMEYIKNLRDFGKTGKHGFDELETYDKLIDVEKVIATAEDEDVSSAERLIAAFNNVNAHETTVPGYLVDRLQTKVKINIGALELIKIYGTESSSLDEVSLEWDFRTSAGGSGKITAAGQTFFSYVSGTTTPDYGYRTIDLPLMIDGREVVAGDKATIYVDGVAHTAVATGTSNDGIMEINKMTGASSNSEIQQMQIETDNASSNIFIKDTKLYKSAEWRIESIKEYRDEYMEVRAVRVRGNRTSRRRAYG